MKIYTFGAENAPAPAAPEQWAALVKQIAEGEK